MGRSASPPPADRPAPAPAPARPRAASRERGFAAWGAGALLAAPLLAVGWPPASDLALHEGAAALLARGGDTALFPKDLYVVSLGHADQLFDVCAAALALAFGARHGCVIALAGTVAASLGFAGRLASHLGRTRYAALAVAPAAFGWALYWGFAAQMLGFALLLGALPVLDRAAARGSLRAAAVASGVTGLLGFAHASSLACACLATTVFALVHPIDRRTALRFLPAGAGVALGLAEVRWEARVETPLARLFARRVLWHPLGAKVRGLAGYVVGAHGWLGEALFLVLIAVVVLLWRHTGPPPEGGSTASPPEPGWRGRLARHRFAVLAAALFVAYLVAPYSINFGAFLYARFLAPAYALGVVLAAPRAGARGPLVVAPAAALLVAPLLLALPQLAAAQRQSSDVEPLIARVDRASAVAVLHFGRHDRSLLFDPTSFGNRVLAERGGRLLFSLCEYPIAPVRVRPDLRWDDLLLRLYAQPGALRPAQDLVRLRWVLAHVVDPGLAARVARALAPEGQLVLARGEWMLFRSTLPAEALPAGPAPAPPESDTLQARVGRLP